jgi:cytochrome c556
MRLLTTTAIAAGVAAMFAFGFVNDTQAQDAAAAVKARSDLMKSNGASVAKINQATDMAAVKEAVATLQANATKLGDAALWPANSATAESRAKPEIWQNMADFQAKLANLKTEETKLASASDVQAAKDQVKVVLASCNACHDAYRGPAKTPAK